MVGGIGLTTLLAEMTDADTGVLRWIADLELENLGFVIVGVFALTWLAALAYWKMTKAASRYDNSKGVS